MRKIALNNNGLNKYNVSIDIIDSFKGYMVDNIQLIGAIINIMKNDIEEKDFLLFIESIVFLDSYNKKS